MKDGGLGGMQRGRGWIRWFSGLCLALLLGGCASVFSAQVTRYQQWPENAQGASYWIATDETQRNNLQFQTYADTVRAALGPTGLVEAHAEAQARFTVHIEYGSPREREWRQEFVDPYMYPGFYGPYVGFHHPRWAWGMGPAIQTVAVDVYRMTLSVRINDRTQQGREVYRATAVASSRQDQLDAAMPYLARAIFDRFPGRNGQVVEVRYPVQ